MCEIGKNYQYQQIEYEQKAMLQGKNMTFQNETEKISNRPQTTKASGRYIKKKNDRTSQG